MVHRILLESEKTYKKYRDSEAAKHGVFLSFDNTQGVSRLTNNDDLFAPVPSVFFNLILRLYGFSI
jgi:hypothetical protein